MENTVIEWSESLELGHDIMDDTHREFIACCKALAEASSADLLLRIDMLIEHSVEHFEQENHWMREHEFPPAACHIGEHESVLEIIREVRRQTEQGDAEIGPRLARELPLWFAHHVATMDGMLAQFMIAQEADTSEKALPHA
ncbi:MAG: bacteriohemerythrin [Paucimonas sp.]|nr:bacteriohemerythrin [Paucimonas sp.]